MGNAKSWFIVKYNWDDDCTCEHHFQHRYLGIGGDLWPQGNANNHTAYYSIFNKLSENWQYINIGNYYVNVCTSLIDAKNYSQFLEAKYKKPILIEVSLDDLEKAAGYDFGQPHGGYSLIETEIFGCRRFEAAKKYLNHHGLFKTRGDINQFISELDLTKVEDLDNYLAVSIREVLF
ncbi:hypothetical protein [Bartonella sp. HY406]|uniref:hypothetical protein n=1 Tax=Bartonella sp. HY406 TaxID=2979331 RepID=UPI0021C6C5F5|nr:hypothetical protein [Bartonella sp. HY406]UXN04274.1 hypothetical protein N6B01_04395 [Bartonella sp. HY406]